MNPEKILQIVGRGFEFSQRHGFIGLRRTPASGITQRVDVFQWSNPKVADAQGIPRAYMVICLTLDGRLEDAGRWRLPLVIWPSEDQPKRHWVVIRKEFDQVFGPALEMTAMEAREYMRSQGERYVL